jgi:hypothetical protein
VTTTLPVFAVVGRVNEGKSSIIATLVEDDTVKIGPEPGTTRRCQRFRMESGGAALFEVVDTPGFQEPEAMLAWLRERDTGAAERPALVREFVRAFKGSGRFSDECELLQPILDGAYILYVADASHPFRPSYEAEIEILRWTGLPRLALINKIAGAGRQGDYTDEWRRALSQYFNFVRVFNAHEAHFGQRIELLTALQVLSDEVRTALQRAVQALERLDRDRRRQAARTIANLLVDALTLTRSEPLPADLLPGEEIPDEQRRLFAAAYCADFTARERRARHAVERLYNYRKLERQESALKGELFEADLFSETTWQFLGLNRGQLIAAGVLTGAAMGGAIDAAVGGHSFLLGTVLGTMAGFASTAFLSAASPTHRMVGIELCGAQLVIGPIDNRRAPNFPWIVLDRAVLHYRSLMERTHAVQGPMHLAFPEDPEARLGVVSTLDARTRGRLGSLFQKIRKGRGSEVVKLDLVDTVVSLLEKRVPAQG